MAITQVRENTATRNTATVASYTHTVTTPASGNVLLLTVSEAIGTGATGAAPSGVATTWTQLGQSLQTSGVVEATELWIGVGPFSGTSVTITKVGSVNASAAASDEWSGLSSTARGAAVTTAATGSGGVPNGATGAALSASVVGDLLYEAMAWRDAGSSITSGPGTGWTGTTGTGQDGSRITPDIKNAYQIAPDLSSHTASYATGSGGGNSYACVGVVISAISDVVARQLIATAQAVRRASVI